MNNRNPISFIRSALGRLAWRRRVPVLRQMSDVECGAACLAMILGYFGRKVRVSDCREALGVGRDGLTAQALAKAARGYGLRVKAYSIEPEALTNVPLPVIVHWNFSHFVVVERSSPHRVEIVDPGLGRRELSRAEFDEGFTGVLLTFEPGAHFERGSGPARAGLGSYLKALMRGPGTVSLLLQVLSASLLLQILGLVLPLFTKAMVDRVLPFRITDVMPMLGLAMGLAVATHLVISLLRSVLLIQLEARLDSQMMLGFFEHLLSLPFRFFQQRSSGDLLMRLASNAQIREALTTQTVSVLLDGAFVLGYLAMLFWLAPHFAWLVFALGIGQVSVLLLTSRRIKNVVAADLATQSASQSYLVEALMGIATVKAAGAEQRALDRWSDLFYRQLGASLKRRQLSAVTDAGMAAIQTLSPLVLLWFGTHQVLGGQMTLGTMMALSALGLAFLAPLHSLIACGQQLQLAGAHLERIADVAEAQPEQEQRQAQESPPLSGRIEIRDVDFQYDPNAPMVLRNISLNIEPGQKVALVGRTGSGKSTLARLLLGLYLPTRGEIRYDDHPLTSLDFRTVRSQCGVVLQETFLFSGSIRENIAFNHPEMTFEQVTQAARLAAIHEEILRMPMGYETRVDEGGSGLSGGQRQRLCLARALAHRPPILLLDEATSHLDVVTEHQVDENVNQLACTRVVVAHRLSTVRSADVILVLDGGTIVEQGTHEELMALDGHYVRLIRNQIESCQPEPEAEWQPQIA